MTIIPCKTCQFLAHQKTNNYKNGFKMNKGNHQSQKIFSSEGRIVAQKYLLSKYL